MLNYELIIKVSGTTNGQMDVLGMDVITAQSLVHLLGQLNIVLVGLAKKEFQFNNPQSFINDDDIPF